MKKLNLYHCSKLIGNGLKPIQGSIALQEIIAPSTDYSTRTVSILNVGFSRVINSILDTDGHSLCKLQLPKKWRHEDDRNKSPIREVLTKFNEMVVDKGHIKCMICDGKRRDDIDEGDDQNDYSTCFTCFKSFSSC